MTAWAQTGVNEAGTSRSAMLPVRSGVNATPTLQSVHKTAPLTPPSDTAATNNGVGVLPGIQPLTLFNSNATTGLGLYIGASKVISGVVTDQNGNPLSRKVIALNPRTYRPIAIGQSSGTGAFTLYLTLSNESYVHVIAEPNSGEARQSVIFSNLAPVAAPSGGSSGASDPLFSSVALLLHGGGANGSTVITDSSSLVRACTAYGNAQISTAQSLSGDTGSLYFDGTSGTYITCVDTPNINFGTSDFTVELYARFATTPFSNQALLTFGTPGSPTFELYRRGGLNLWSGTATIITGVTTLNTGSWYHLAWTRASGIHSLFVNGNLEGTVLSSGAIDPTGIILGSYTGTLDMMNGYVDEVRVTLGAARYTGTFVPSYTAFPNH